jgi:hypothetical protein
MIDGLIFEALGLSTDLELGLRSAGQLVMSSRLFELDTQRVGNARERTGGAANFILKSSTCVDLGAALRLADISWGSDNRARRG